MRLNFKRPDDKAEADRQMVIAYKNFFKSEFGKVVFSDLGNRYNMITAIKETDPMAAARAEGARAVICYILYKANVNLAEFEKILSGDYSSITGEEKNE